MNSVFLEYNWGVSQSYLLGRVVKCAQRSQKIHFRLRKKRPDSLWRPQPLSHVLQEFANSPFPADFRSLARLRSSGLPSRRLVSGPCLFHRGGSGARRKHPMPDSQRTHSPSAGAQRISPSGYAAHLLAAFWPPALARPARGPRQTSHGTFSPLGPPLQRHRGCRYDGVDDLRVAGGRSAGLHSQATPRAAVLRTPGVQRRSPWPQPGDGVEGRECSFVRRGGGVPQPHLAQGTPVDRCRAHAGAIGRSFLRSQDYRAPGKSRARPCGGGADVRTSEAKDDGCLLSRIRPRLGGRRVYLHSLPLEKRASFRGRASTEGGGDGRDSKALVHRQEAHLPPGAGHQLGADSCRGLAFLLRPRRARTVAAGAQGLLRDGQNSDPELLGQRRLHGSDPLGLRLGLGVPAPLSASGSTPLEHLHPSPRALVASGRMGKAWESQSPGPAGEVSPARSVCQNPASRRPSATAHLTEFARVPTSVLCKTQEI